MSHLRSGDLFIHPDDRAEGPPRRTRSAEGDHLASVEAMGECVEVGKPGRSRAANGAVTNQPGRLACCGSQILEAAFRPLGEEQRRSGKSHPGGKGPILRQSAAGDT